MCCNIPSAHFGHRYAGAAGILDTPTILVPSFDDNDVGLVQFIYRLLEKFDRIRKASAILPLLNYQRRFKARSKSSSELVFRRRPRWIHLAWQLSACTLLMWYAT
jgi:hypothetical protein